MRDHGPRPAAQRKADTLAALTTPALDGWVASATVEASGALMAHLVPLSLAWTGDRLVIAVELASRTARGIAECGRARIGLGPTRDVVVIDAVLESSVAVADAPLELAQRYAAQADWDPRQDAGSYGYLVLRPERIQAWREADELPGRTLMRGGTWLV